MNREEFEATVWAIAGRHLQPKQVRLIVEAAHTYATGDTEQLTAHRRQILARDNDGQGHRYDQSRAA